MLPAEAFKPRSPPRTQNQGQYSSYHDDQYDDYYGRGNHNTAYGSSSNYEYNEPYSNQNTNEQQYQSPVQTPSAATGANSGGGGGSGSSVNSVSLLQGAIADLGKLVSSEEDASMALQVSNALTQALLQFRMNNLPQEGAANNSAAASGATPTNPGT